MSLVRLSKTKASRVMGIDCSTHSLAFCIYYNRKPIKWGKVNFQGADVFERMADAAAKVRAMMATGEFDVDYIAFESAILAKVSNADVTIKLAMVYGVCIAELMRSGTKVVTVKPLEWQSAIGNPNLKKPEKDVIKAQHPGMSASYYQQKGRELRKQRTMDYFNKHFPKMNIDDNDVGDSCGIARFAYYQLTTRS